MKKNLLCKSVTAVDNCQMRYPAAYAAKGRTTYQAIWTRAEIHAPHLTVGN